MVIRNEEDYQQAILILGVLVELHCPSGTLEHQALFEMRSLIEDYLRKEKENGILRSM